MKNYVYENNLVGKKQLREILGWTFLNYNSLQSSLLADELKYIGFKYASQAGISISIEDLRVPFSKNLMIDNANQELIDSQKIFLKGKLTDVERLQKIIDTWSLTSESLKTQVIYYFKNYDPLNSVYIMAFSGARGNLSQVRQLVGMRGLMSDPSGQIMNLAIKKNFREGLTITDYLMSGYGARKGIVDTALKTANSGYLTRRLIDVAQDIFIREKDCLTTHSFFLSVDNSESTANNECYSKMLGLILNKSIIEPSTNLIIAKFNTQITPTLIKTFKQKNIKEFYIRSPLTCKLYRSVCQKCYGWDLANQNLVDVGEAIGILAGQSIGEPGTQLTMRTFHTGGIFTSEARQQILSPLNCIAQFSKYLKTVALRTNRGEDVLVTKNSGSLILIPDSDDQKVIQIELLRNTIIFIKNNQYLRKNAVIGELINVNRQIKREVKPIIIYDSGEIVVPKLKNRINLLTNNKLLWILSGQLYNAPLNSFINFPSDYKLNKFSFIFRTKIINNYPGVVEMLNSKTELSLREFRIRNSKYLLLNSKFKALSAEKDNFNHILIYQNLKYLVKTEVKNSKISLKLNSRNEFAKLLTNSYISLTGGRCFYDYRTTTQGIPLRNKIPYYKELFGLIGRNASLFCQTLIWVPEENYKVNCDQNILLVKQGDLIAENFEFTPDCFSKTSGLVFTTQKNSFVQKLKIKSGSLYQGKDFSHEAKKFYYPGEEIFENVVIAVPSICERFLVNNIDQLLIRPIQLYEFPKLRDAKQIFQTDYQFCEILKLKTNSKYIYKSNQQINTSKEFKLISHVLKSKMDPSISMYLDIEFSSSPRSTGVNIEVLENIHFNNYIEPKLKYRNIQSCLLAQKNQFIDSYTVFAYLEAFTLKAVEIVKFKNSKELIKQVFLISNENCVIVDRKEVGDKRLNDFIVDTPNINGIGKIIIEGKNFVTIQKGRPYFFPNCKKEELENQSNLQYKIVNEKYNFTKIRTNRRVCLTSYNMFKISVHESAKLPLERKLEPLSDEDKKKDADERFRISVEQLFKPLEIRKSSKLEFSKFFLKKNAKLYSCLVPRFLKKFTVTNKTLKKKVPIPFRCSQKKGEILTEARPVNRTLLLKTSQILPDELKSQPQFQLTLVKFLQYPLIRTAKSVGLHSITEDFFEEEVNSLFYHNNQFIDGGTTIGLLNLEKEITGDIVQGLPRIEEILEARKKNSLTKRIPTNQKKGLLTQKTSLDPNFEFRKVGTSVKENEKMNAHKLLKVYFNYYGLLKTFYSDTRRSVRYSRLMSNSEGSYKSFKKVQAFILNSVQSVYKSQGVAINDKHLEVIIKQMTTKVLITYEGDTPLLRREIIDLYHIEYMNEVLQEVNKEVAYYVPLLFGITKGALNNPSFISAASFQETTRVLTKAAIEGRVDWLRGLKENIIIGHLIPAGTGSRTYKTNFKKSILK